MPLISVDKHKVLQILVNVIRNAKYACDESGRRREARDRPRSRRRTARCRSPSSTTASASRRRTSSRIFSHGFTTRKDGHGFGLHSGALAAKELGGSLHGESAGPGQGATFTLTLPLIRRSRPMAR